MQKKENLQEKLYSVSKVGQEVTLVLLFSQELERLLGIVGRLSLTIGCQHKDNQLIGLKISQLALIVQHF